MTATRLVKDQAQLDSLFTGDVLVFKHSTACPISTGAFEQFKKFTTGNPAVHTALIYVIEDRALSLSFAQRSGIKHESPQAILMKDGRAVWNASHTQITAASLQQAASL